MKPVRHRPPGAPAELASFVACLATILELDPATLPMPPPSEDGPTGWTLSRWLGGLGMGLVPIADPDGFTWPGPWLARVATADAEPRFVVMYGVPSGVVWDPAGDGVVDRSTVRAGYVMAATDIALARPRLPEPPGTTGRVQGIWLAARAGQPATGVGSAHAVPGRGLLGDRHTTGRGTFPSGAPGSALTLIDAAVCASFDPPLGPDEHRRNLVIRGIDLNRLVGHQFTVGEVRCRGARLCEPCTVVQRYAGRPILRALVHRGGLRADILSNGEIAVGDAVAALAGG
ncbi:MAG: MOSC domain-containing protein [Actinomycetota bacterium]|nr:MOSC domain-containing protein [Actinomycetota bacterium]